MRLTCRMWIGAGLLAAAAPIVGAARGDEPKGLGRLFRFGSSSTPAAKPEPRTPDYARPAAPGANAPGLYGAAPGPSTGRAASAQPIGPGAFGPAATPPATGAVPAYTPTEAVGAGPSAAPRIAPQPRNSKPFTESDPLVTRITLGRSDNGQQFAMFLQVYADGTVLDGEGVHRVNREALRPLVEAIASGELSKAKGHCGGPSTDFVEQVHVTVFERNMGRLKANAFSYSGNPQGCDHSVHHLQRSLDEIQAKISPAMGTPVADAGAPEGLAAPYAAAPTPPPAASPAPPLPLTVVP